MSNYSEERTRRANLIKERTQDDTKLIKKVSSIVMIISLVLSVILTALVLVFANIGYNVLNKMVNTIFVLTFISFSFPLCIISLIISIMSFLGTKQKVLSVFIMVSSIILIVLNVLAFVTAFFWPFF